MRQFVRDEINKTAQVMTSMMGDDAILGTIEAIGAACIKALREGHKVLFSGNGGSAADAQHLAAEMVGRLAYDRPALPAIALTTDTSILTAIGNDYGYDEVFARQVDALGQAGDVFIGISTSGRSRNVMRALERARAKGIVTVGMTGAGGGDMLALCDHCLCIPALETTKIQEGHIVSGHIFCGIVERTLFARVE